MPFNSIAFLAFLLALLIVFYAFDRKFRLQVLAFASLTFYCFNGLFSAAVLLLIILITYLFSINYNGRNIYAVLSIFLIILILFCSKLALQSSFYDSVFISIAYPMGLSFYSLQAIGYIIDVKDGKIDADRAPVSLGLFLSFFMQSVAGPIHRYSQLSTQFQNIGSVGVHNISGGLKVALWGYICKLIIADKIELAIMPVLSMPESNNGLALFVASILYSFQIYFDFYGYTLIAIGVAWMFGIKMAENFDSPYVAKSFREFWRRWHITLSRWLRDYVYIRIGGRSSSFWQLGLTVTATFLVSAIWHGLAINFIFWGLLHAFFYLSEEAFARRKWFKGIKQNPLFNIIQRFKFFVLLSLSWLVFRTTDISKLEIIIGKIFNVQNWSISSLNAYATSIYLVFILIVPLVFISNANKWVRTLSMKEAQSVTQRSFEIAYVTACVLLLLVFGDLGTREFLYFKF